MSTSVTTRDGLRLFLQHWPRTPAAGTVLIVHGLGEHSGRYAALAEALNGWGWHVVGYDQRGHGASPGERGCITESDDLLHDLAAAIEHVRAARPGRLVLLGHSMGGVVAARFVAGALDASPWTREVEALVLSSPALDVGLTAGRKRLLGLLGAVVPDLRVGNGLKPAWLSHDATVVQAYRADPLVHDRISPRLLRFIVEAGLQVRRLAPAWRMPTLLMYAGSDRCVAPAGSAAFAEAAPRQLVDSHEFEPLFHEIFNETERAPVLETLRLWLGEATPGLARAS